MKPSNVLKWPIAILLLPALAMATKVTTVHKFGAFGDSIENAEKTDFFTFFHLVETGRAETGGCETIRFQPSGPQFHDLVTLNVEIVSGHIGAATLHLKRSFIDSHDEAFARDIAASFLDHALADETAVEARNLIGQIRKDYRGEVMVISGPGADRKVPLPITPEYMAFLGQRVQESGSFQHMDISLINTNAQGRELLMRVELARPKRIASPCGTLGRK